MVGPPKPSAIHMLCFYVEIRLIVKSRQQVKQEKAVKRASYLAMVVDAVPLYESVAFKKALRLVETELRYRFKTSR